MSLDKRNKVLLMLVILFQFHYSWIVFTVGLFSWSMLWTLEPKLWLSWNPVKKSLTPLVSRPPREMNVGSTCLSTKILTCSWFELNGMCIILTQIICTKIFFLLTSLVYGCRRIIFIIFRHIQWNVFNDSASVYPNSRNEQQDIVLEWKQPRDLNFEIEG